MIMKPLIKLTSYKQSVQWQQRNIRLVTHAMKRAKMMMAIAIENVNTSVEHSMPSANFLMNSLLFIIVELVLIIVA